MKASRAERPQFKAAPPTKRANPAGVPVRLNDGALVAHVTPEIANEILSAGAAVARRNGPRRYLRLKPGLVIPHVGGWDIMEHLRKWLGDQRAAAYVRYKDIQCERLREQLPVRPEKQEPIAIHLTPLAGDRKC